MLYLGTLVLRSSLTDNISFSQENCLIRSTEVGYYIADWDLGLTCVCVWCTFRGWCRTPSSLPPTAGGIRAGTRPQVPLVVGDTSSSQLVQYFGGLSGRSSLSSVHCCSLHLVGPLVTPSSVSHVPVVPETVSPASQSDEVVLSTPALTSGVPVPCTPPDDPVMSQMLKANGEGMLKRRLAQGLDLELQVLEPPSKFRLEAAKMNISQLF